MSGIVYVVQAETGGPVKIGYSREGGLKSRVASLQTGNPYKLRVVHTEPGSVEDERELHRTFRRYRMSGEWFRAHYELQERFPDIVYEHEDVSEASVMYDKGYSDGWERGYDDGTPCKDCGERALCECPDTPASIERERRIADADARQRFYALRGTFRGAGRKRVAK